MIISTLELESFRCFSKISVNFEDDLTVFIGINAAGKTSLLDALAIYLESLALQIKYDDYGIAPRLKRSDFPYTLGNVNHAHLYFEVKNIAKAKYEFPIDQSSTDLDIEPNSYDAKAQKKVYEALRSKKSEDGLPVLVYYRSKRTSHESVSRESSNTYKAYADAFAVNIDFWSSLEWFDAKDAEEARVIRDSRGNPDYDPEYELPELRAVRDAVSIALGDYENPRMSGTPPRMRVTKKSDGLDYLVSDLSDGYRTMLALVVDLARRMAVLNENILPKDELLNSPGIVLIDEVELHLHPSWQQRVLPDLMRIFPNTQFIVATHSPQVISSIEKRQIRILESGKIYTPEIGTFGADSSRILEDLFNVQSRPKDNKAKKELDFYFSLIEEGKGRSKEAEKSRARLEEWLAGDPELDKADLYIRRQDRLARRGDK